MVGEGKLGNEQSQPAHGQQPPLSHGEAKEIAWINRRGNIQGAVIVAMATVIAALIPLAGVLISRASSTGDNPKSSVSPPPSATRSLGPQFLPEPHTGCPPVNDPKAKAATVISQVDATYPVSAGPAYYVVNVAGVLQLEVGGELRGNIPSDMQLFLLLWADPATKGIDGNSGNGLYYRSDSLAVTGHCFDRPMHSIAYDGAQGIKFRNQLVLVRKDRVSEFLKYGSDVGYNDEILAALDIVRLAYFDVPTSL